MTKSTFSWKKLLTLAVFFALSIPMFYFIDGAVSFGGFGFMYHYLLGAVIVLLAFTVFLLKPDLTYAINLLEDSSTLALVYILMVLWSFIIWSVQFEGQETIIKGIFENIYVLLAVMVAASCRYLFREKSVLYCCYAMSIANMMIIIPVFLENPSDFISELINLVMTFGDDTGPLMKSIEIHDLTFAFGLIFLYALIRRGLTGRIRILILSGIFSITGLKRIAVAGIVLGYVIYEILLHVKKYKKYVYLLCGAIIAATFLYLCAVHYGLYDYLEQIGLNTKGRNLIYGHINTLFYIGPGFLGNGLGFSSKSWNLPFYSKLFQDAYHNEFLKMYVEMGFWGYFAWIFFHLPFRIWYFIRQRGQSCGLMYLATAIYCYITYATDNTYYYYYLNFAVFLIVFGAEEGYCIASHKKNKKKIRRYVH